MTYKRPRYSIPFCSRLQERQDNMHHFLPSNDQVSPKPETRVSQTETSPTGADAALYTGSSKDCCDSYGSSIPFQNFGYAGLWGLESTSPGFAFSPSQTPTDLVLDDPFASSCNGQTTPEMTSSSNDVSQTTLNRCKINSVTDSFAISVNWCISTKVRRSCKCYLHCEL